MKEIKKIGLIVCLIIMASCSSTKNIGNVQRDGSSFEKAIIANSISSEYEYVRKVCSDCQLLGQSLVFEKKKPYDILKLKKPNGEEVSYYFDISNFDGFTTNNYFPCGIPFRSFIARIWSSPRRNSCI